MNLTSYLSPPKSSVLNTKSVYIYIYISYIKRALQGPQQFFKSIKHRSANYGLQTKSGMLSTMRQFQTTAGNYSKAVRAIQLKTKTQLVCLTQRPFITKFFKSYDFSPKSNFTESHYRGPKCFICQEHLLQCMSCIKGATHVNEPKFTLKIPAPQTYFTLRMPY